MRFVHPYVAGRDWDRCRGLWYPLATSTDGSVSNRTRPRRLPPTTVAADPNRQRYGLGGPVYFYADHHRPCPDCARRYVFSAVEQHHWYEELGFILDSHPSHCPSCRGRRRAVRDAGARIARATAAGPNDARAQADLAEALVDHLLLAGVGDPARAVAAARRAIRLDGDLAQPRYWLARAEEVAGRFAAAAHDYREFLDTRATSDASTSALAVSAGRRLAALRARGIAPR